MKDLKSFGSEHSQLFSVDLGHVERLAAVVRYPVGAEKFLYRCALHRILVHHPLNAMPRLFICDLLKLYLFSRHNIHQLYEVGRFLVWVFAGEQVVEGYPERPDISCRPERLSLIVIE